MGTSGGRQDCPLTFGRLRKLRFWHKLAVMTLRYIVWFGNDIGLTLRPHRYKGGYRASEAEVGPHAHVNNEDGLIPYMQRGWSIRMSAKGHPPSLITPASVSGWRKL
jgi:hypothetical protein